MKVDVQTEAKLRAAIVAETLTWLGTPFHARAAVKGHGVECGWLPYGVLRDLKLLPEGYTMPEYSIQFWMHHNHEVYIEGILKAGLHEIDPPPKPGDLIVAKMGRVYAHGGIVVDWPWIVHAHSRMDKVVKVNGELDDILGQDNKRKFFSLFE